MTTDTEALAREALELDFACPGPPAPGMARLGLARQGNANHGKDSWLI